MSTRLSPVVCVSVLLHASLAPWPVAAVGSIGQTAQPALGATRLDATRPARFVVRVELVLGSDVLVHWTRPSCLA
jgi:hypothetical protein